MIAAAHRAHPTLSIRQLCGLFGVGRTWYYTHPTAEASAARDLALRAAIERTVLDFPGYGYRRVTKALQRAGWVVNHKRVLRVMREESLLCHLKRRFVPTTDSQHGHRRYPNLIKALTLTHPNQVWAADITYIRLPQAFVYLAAILDGYSSLCFVWHLSLFIDTDRALGAQDQELRERRPPPGLIHHSDQGVQYASGAYVARLEAAGARISMAAVGNPYENAQAESFFKTLKREEVYLNDYATVAEAQRRIDHFIADVYNTKRLHSSLGYQPPAEFEGLVTLSAASG